MNSLAVTNQALDGRLDEFVNLYLRAEVIEPILRAIGIRQVELTDVNLMAAARFAKILAFSESWLYWYADRLPYTVKLANNMVRFSGTAIQKEIARKLKIRAREP